MNEEWRAIPGFEGRYEISNTGRLKRIGRKLGGPRLKNGIRRIPIDRIGYGVAVLFKDSVHYTFRIHQLVAMSFIGPCPEGMEVNHIDGNKMNNVPSNLEYVTRSENLRHSYDVLGNKAARGERAPGAKATKAEVDKARAMIAAGVSKLEIGKHFGRHRLWGYEITDGSTWKD